MICLPYCNEGEEKNCETNDGDVQAILFAFEMVKSVDWYLANLLNQMEKAKKSNADGEDAWSDEQWKETILKGEDQTLRRMRVWRQLCGKRTCS